MKFLLVLVAAICITAVYCGEFDPPAKAEVMKCITESKVDMNLFQELHNNPNFVPTREMHCFAACVMKRRNMMDESGKYTEAFEKTEISKECKPEYGKDACETAGKFMACITKNDRSEKLRAKLAKSL